MAEGLKHVAGGTVRNGGNGMMYLLSAFAAVWSCQAAAEDLPDPTRPPPGIYAPMSAAGGGYKQAAGLQSVIISGRRRAAIINGVTVELGGRIGNARLVTVNEAYVVLQGKRGRQVLSLFPDVKISARRMQPELQSPAVSAQPGKPMSRPAARGEGK